VPPAAPTHTQRGPESTKASICRGNEEPCLLLGRGERHYHHRWPCAIHGRGGAGVPELSKLTTRYPSEAM